MKIRTLNELQDILDIERGWRVKEIDEIKHAARDFRARTGLAPKTVVRAGIPLLYAHWEGFVKKSSAAYLTFVSSRRLKYNELAAPFVVFGAKKHLMSLTNSKKAAVNIAAVEFFLSHLSDQATLSFPGVIDAESNLSSLVFENIAASIGINTTWYETKYHLIDEQLLDKRNKIAHGEFLDIDHDAFRSLADHVIGLITAYKTDIQNAASLDAYRG